jgi:hypothetical protein
VDAQCFFQPKLEETPTIFLCFKQLEKRKKTRGENEKERLLTALVLCGFLSSENRDKMGRGDGLSPSGLDYRQSTRWFYSKAPATRAMIPTMHSAINIPWMAFEFMVMPCMFVPQFEHS